MNMVVAASRQAADSSASTPSSLARFGWRFAIRIPPGSGLLRVDAEFPGPFRMALRHVSGRCQVPLGHQVGVDVVVGDGTVLVRAGDPVDVEPPPGIMVA